MKDMSAAYRANQEIIRKLRSKPAERGLTLAILCDMILGEDAEDRSDDALIRAVERLLQTQPCGHPAQAISQNEITLVGLIAQLLLANIYMMEMNAAILKTRSSDARHTSAHYCHFRRIRGLVRRILHVTEKEEE